MMTTDEKVMVARNVIEVLDIKDEDLKQEIYLRALQFNGTPQRNCDMCNDQKMCLYKELRVFVQAYEINEQRHVNVEIPVAVSLRGIDDFILTLLFGRM